MLDRDTMHKKTSQKTFKFYYFTNSLMHLFGLRILFFSFIMYFFFSF